MTQYELRYKGIPLLLNTPEADAAFAFLAPGALGLPGRGAPYGHNPPNDSLCRFQPGEPFTPRLNVLYWPTGAQRHAIGWFLVDDKTLKAISLSSEKSILKMGDPDDPDSLIQAEIFPLQPIPIPYLKSDEPAKTVYVYVLPLVDARYKWISQLNPTAIERKPTGIAWQAFTAWQTILDELAAMDGFHVTNSILVPGGFDAEFLQADTASVGLFDADNDLTRTIADTVDAVAWNNLRRNVWPYSITSGSASEPRSILERPEDSETSHKANVTKFVNTAGTPSAPHRRRGGWAWGEANLTSQDATANEGSFGNRGLLSAIALRACFVDKESRKPNKGHYDTLIRPIFNAEFFSDFILLVARDTVQTYSNGSNSGVLDNLNMAAEKSISDWQKYFFDFTLNGICNWKPNGYADVIEFCYRKEDCYTRVRSWPVDWWRAWNGVFNHQSADALRPLPDYIEATVTADIASGNSGPATVSDETARTVTLSTPFGDLAANDLVGAVWNSLTGDGRFEAIVKKC